MKIFYDILFKLYKFYFLENNYNINKIYLYFIY